MAAADPARRHRVPRAPAAAESSTLSGDAGAWTVGATPLADNRPAIEALKSADLVIDPMFLLFSKEQLEIQEAGTRMLLCVEPIEHLMQLFPTADLRQRVEAGEELLGKRPARCASRTRAGTDVHLQARRLPASSTEYGYTDTPGRWDHWPSGFLFTGGADDGVDGKVVLAPGDIISPVQELRADAGRDHDRAGPHRRHPRRARRRPPARLHRRFDDEKAYGIAHIGWG